MAKNCFNDIYKSLRRTSSPPALVFLPNYRRANSSTAGGAQLAPDTNRSEHCPRSRAWPCRQRVKLNGRLAGRPRLSTESAVAHFVQAHLRPARSLCVWRGEAERTMVRETRHLWVGNLPEHVREEKIVEHFKRWVTQDAPSREAPRAAAAAAARGAAPPPPPGETKLSRGG